MAKNKQQIKFEADISGFKSAIKESEKLITGLNKELKLNSEQLKGNSQNVNLLQTRLKELKDKYKEQTEIVDNTSKALETAKETFGENSEEAQKWSNKLVEAKTAQQKIKNAIDETTEQLKKQTSGWIDNGKQLQEAGKIVENVGDKINSLGNKVSVVSAGIGAALVGTSKAAIDYESAFAGVVKTVDGTDEQLQAINDGILEMSTRMPAAATEIAGVAESAGQLGIKTDDILNFSEVMINLGESTNLSANEAASSLAKFANITNMSADDYGRLGSVIVDLGNNFATTEADIVSMATRLAATGELTGLSHSQIMALAAAMSSVGIEAEAGGSAMSKLLKNIQVAVETGSDELKDFASVAGVSTSEFKKAFEEDAVGALSMFLAGLQDTERNGKSAIAILDDMGIKEVRLSNTVLSLSNAHEVLSDAVNTANTAWEENTALQNEADKRYATTESQIEMLKNEAKKLAVEFGRELLPTLKDLIKDAKPLLELIADAVKKFSSLDDKTKKTIITMSGMSVALGPAIKTVGTITSATGKAITSFGNLSEKIGKTKIETDKLGTSSKMTAGQIASIAGIAITVGAALISLAYKKTETQKAAEELETQIKSTREAFESYNDSINKNMSVELAQISNAEKLNEELKVLVDENGNVKSGYESRVEFILGELNEALGTEYRLNGNIVESYTEIQNSIGATIEKRKAEIRLSASEERYKKAIENQQQYNEELATTRKALQDFADEYGVTTEQLIEKAGEWENELAGKPEVLRTVYDTERQKVVDAVNSLVNAHDTAKNNLKENYDQITAYESDYAEFAAGNYENVGKVAVATVEEYSDISLTELRRAISAKKTELEDYTQNFKETGDSLAEEGMKRSEQDLKILSEELIKRTSTVNGLGQEEVTAWRLLAQSSVDVYAGALANLDDETIRNIQDATGCVVSDEQLTSAFQNLGKENIDGFKSNDFRQAGVDASTDVKNGCETISLFSTGQNVGSGFASGLLEKVRSAINIAKNKTSVNSSNADGLAYVPYNGYVARLHEGERILTKAENADYMANRINNNNNNLTVNIYPQTMTEGEMAKVSQYIERSWGKRS